MAAEIFKILSNLRMVLDSETDADSPDNETTYPAIRQMIEMLFTLCFGEAVGSLTSDPPDDATGYLIDTAGGFTTDEHNGRTALFTSGDGKGLFYTIDDTVAASNRCECTGDNLYADGIRSGDDYVILYDIKNNADGHDHDGINSKSAILADLSIATAKYANASVTNTKLKTVANTTGLSGTLAAATSIGIAMQDYGFSPNIYSINADIRLRGHPTSTADTTARFGLYNVNATTGRAYACRWRYVTASDEPFVYALRHKITGKVEHLWACDDPPPRYWGLTEKPQDFISPLLLETDGKNHDEIVAEQYDEIVCFLYDRDSIIEIGEKAGQDKKLPFEVLEDYEFDETKNLFVLKNLVEI